MHEAQPKGDQPPALGLAPIFSYEKIQNAHGYDRQGDGRLDHRVRQADGAEASRDRVLALYAQGVLRAFAEVESTLAAERLLAAEEAAQAVATEESNAAVRLAEDRYNAGVGDYLTILESQRQAFLTESRLLTLRTLRLSNRADLHLALGGDFGTRQDDPTPSD